MDKNQYKELISEYMRKEAKLKQQIEDLELKLEQQTQDFHFDMRNKHMEETILKNRIDILESKILELQTENSEMRDRLIELGEDV